ncbi:DNA-binding GntR family transcriptional regulator [Rhodococcus sp. 27YEA15]|uniref:GntR family transcriptional regulator n=1 Tax=Rhodococcus sp. 27YEA15 TaxID=3156259 RepID=UPI003C7B61A8
MATVVVRPPTGTSSTPRVIASALRGDLLEGTLEPGDRLREESLVARFSVGRHSVRAAIQMLVTEGLLVHERNKGAVVPAVTTERIDEICSYRSVIELGALRMALARGADWTGVERAVEKLEALSNDALWREVMEAHSAVHHEIVAASHNDRIVRAHRACETELAFMLAAVRPDYSVERLAVIHRELWDKLCGGGDAAVRALDDDLERGGRAAMHAALQRRSEIS